MPASSVASTGNVIDLEEEDENVTGKPAKRFKTDGVSFSASAAASSAAAVSNGHAADLQLYYQFSRQEVASKSAYAPSSAQRDSYPTSSTSTSATNGAAVAKATIEIVKTRFTFKYEVVQQEYYKKKSRIIDDEDDDEIPQHASAPEEATLFICRGLHELSLQILRSGADYSHGYLYDDLFFVMRHAACWSYQERQQADEYFLLYLRYLFDRLADYMQQNGYHALETFKGTFHELRPLKGQTVASVPPPHLHVGWIHGFLLVKLPLPSEATAVMGYVHVDSYDFLCMIAVNAAYFEAARTEGPSPILHSAGFSLGDQFFTYHDFSTYKTPLHSYDPGFKNIRPASTIELSIPLTFLLHERFTKSDKAESRITLLIPKESSSDIVKHMLDTDVNSIIFHACYFPLATAPSQNSLGFQKIGDSYSINTLSRLEVQRCKEPSLCGCVMAKPYNTLLLTILSDAFDRLVDQLRGNHASREWLEPDSHLFELEKYPLRIFRYSYAKMVKEFAVDKTRALRFRDYFGLLPRLHTFYGAIYPTQTPVFAYYVDTKVYKAIVVELTSFRLISRDAEEQIKNSFKMSLEDFLYKFFDVMRYYFLSENGIYPLARLAAQRATFIHYAKYLIQMPYLLLNRCDISNARANQGLTYHEPEKRNPLEEQMYCNNLQYYIRDNLGISFQTFKEIKIVLEFTFYST